MGQRYSARGLSRRIFLLVVIALSIFGSACAKADYTLGPEILIQAGGTDLTVSGYSVPQLFDWNNDDLPDLIVGEGGGGSPDALVRVYLNSGTTGAPVFADYFLVQAGGTDLNMTASGCLGCAPCCVYWDDDQRKDLIVGLADGTVKIFLNVTTDQTPEFDAGTPVYYSPAGVQTEIDVGARAIPTVVDWNSDGMKDLVVGSLDGRVLLFLNEGTDQAPVFNEAAYAQAFETELYVPTNRSSPAVIDLDGDGKKDLLTGNTEAQLLQYTNQGTDSEPMFGEPVALTGGGTPIDLPGYLRSRISLCDWESDGNNDVLLGSGDGHVRLYLETNADSVPEVPSLNVALAQPWPNPFNPRLMVSFSVEQTAMVDICVYGVDGGQVDVLTSQVYPAGDYDLEWDGRTASGDAAASGTYFVRLVAGNELLHRKVVLVR